MNRRSILGLLLVIVVAAIWIFWAREPAIPPAPVIERDQPAALAVSPSTKVAGPEAPVASATEPEVITTVPQPAMSSPALTVPLPNGPASVEADLDNVQFAIRDFRTALKENPVGSNAEITKALLGDNLKQVKGSIPPGSSINAEGELCDRWGTPYFFHQLSAKQMEVRSAGPDRKMWTSDDREMK